MPRTKQVAVKEKHIEVLKKLKAKVAIPSATKAPGLIGGVRKPVRFRNVTLALRAMSREQKNSTGRALRKAPFTRIIRRVCSQYKSDIFLRPSTVELLDHIVAAETVKILSNAFFWRCASLTTSQQRKQHCVQVSGSYVQKAQQMWERDHPGTFDLPEGSSDI